MSGQQPANNDEKVVMYPPPPPPEDPETTAAANYGTTSSVTPPPQLQQLQQPPPPPAAAAQPASSSSSSSAASAGEAGLYTAHHEQPRPPAGTADAGAAAASYDVAHATAPPLSVLVDADGQRGGPLLQGSEAAPLSPAARGAEADCGRAAASSVSSSSRAGGDGRLDPRTPLLDKSAQQRHIIPDGGGLVTLDDMPPRGSSVTVVGLHANYSLNGKTGTVLGYRSDGGVLVALPTEGIECAPLHPHNLSWGAPEPSYAAAGDRLENMVIGTVGHQTSHFDGMTILRVPPSGRGRSGFKENVSVPQATHDPDGCCCVRSGWGDLSIYPIFCGTLLNLVLAMVSFSLCSALLLLTFFFPCFFTQYAILIRWFAHKHVRILLHFCPPDMGVVATHPNAKISGGTIGSYFGSCHTWKSLAYLLMVCPILSFISMFVITFSMALSLPFFCCRPLYSCVTSIAWAFITFERSVACAVLTHTVCEYDLYVQEFGTPSGCDEEACRYRAVGNSAASSPVEGPETSIMQSEDVLGRQVVTNTGDGGHTYEGAPPTVHSDTEHTYGSSVMSGYLTRRQRTSEESMALDKFNLAFTRLFGRAGRLQDITVAPPREPGRGPRHYITLADTLSDAERLKVIKAYKQAFSTMYVHIIDIDEQQRQEGTDYSELYS